MLAAERQKQILASLEQEGTVRTKELADRFQVTDETIRRDFQVLAELQQLTRIHGGASSLNGRPTLRSYAERRSVNVDRKQAIAKEALSRILPGQTYAFDSSTTSFALVSFLPDLPYRVVTNAYAVLEHLVGMTHVELISTGGRYRPKTQTFTGQTSVDTLLRHNIHTAFVSCIGIDPQRGASEGFEQQALFKERLVQLAEEVVLLADSSKLLQRSEYFFAAPDQISRIITDRDADPVAVAELRGAGLDVTVAE